MAKAPKTKKYQLKPIPIDFLTSIWYTKLGFSLDLSLPWEILNPKFAISHKSMVHLYSFYPT